MTEARCLGNIVRKYAFQWRGGFNLSPLILYPLRAIIAVSEDDACEFDKKRCMRIQTFRPFFHFFNIPKFMVGKNIWAAAATPAAPIPTPMQFYAVF